MITGKPYDVLKFCALIVFPVLGTLYFTLAGIWNLPAAEQIVGTIVAVDTFLGIVLQISSNRFNQNTAAGTLNIEETPSGSKVFGLELEGDPEMELEGKDRVVFQVNKTKRVARHKATSRSTARPARR